LITPSAWVHSWFDMPSKELAALTPVAGVEASEPRTETDRRARLRGMVAQHHATVWRFLRRLGLDEDDADDAIQDVLMVAMRKLDAIDPRAERTYLLRTAYRVGCRIRAKRPQVGDEDVPDPFPHPDVLTDQKRARELLDDLLARMNEELRAVLVLHDIEKLTMAEIAETLELKPGTVASRLRRAREDFDKRVARVEARLREGRR
jgi:RNA polymerase sigma-70 factor, ECF subfamily